MKQIYTAIFLALAFCSHANAQNWTAPTPKTGAEFTSDTTIYMYNVKEHKFLSRGASWGTHAVISDTGIGLRFSIYNEESETPQWVITCTDTNKKLFRSSGSDVYTDYQNKGCYYWNMTQTGEGYYRFSTDTGKFGNTTIEEEMGGFLLGWDSEGNDINGQNGEQLGTNIHVYMCNVPDNGESRYSVDWEFVAEDDYLTYEARYLLYDALLIAYDKGVDITEASALYEDGSATLEQLAEATENLRQEIINATYKDATEDNPIGLTDDFITNPSFEGRSLTGWTATGIHMNDNANKSYSNSETEVTINNFVEYWVKSGALSDADIHQTLSGLPEGKYKIGADIIATNQNDQSSSVSGVYLYGTTASLNQKTVCTTENNKPEHFEVEIVVSKGEELTIGFMCEGTTANWIAVDNFQLTYYGKTNQSAYYLALGATIEQAKDYQNKYEDPYIFSETTLDMLQEAIDKATDVFYNGNTDEEFQSAIDELNEAIETVNKEIAAYNEMAALISQMEGDIETYADYTGLLEWISENYSSCQNKYDQHTFTTEEINEIVASYKLAVAQIKLIESIKSDAGQYSEYAELAEALNKMVEEQTDILNNATYTDESIADADAAYKALIAACFEDLTGLIYNPSFETRSFEQEDNLWMVEGLHINDNANKAYTNGEVQLYHFVEIWEKSGNVADSYIQQEIGQTLPEGIYMLGADVIAHDQVTGEEVTGITLFVTTGDQEFSVNCYTPDNNKPEHYSIKFTLESEAKVTIGLRVKDTNANWAAVDNFTLTHYNPAGTKTSLPGDVNGDGTVDINDVVAVINHMAGTTTYERANVNEDTDEAGNDIVDINDVVAVINIMAGN